MLENGPDLTAELSKAEQELAAAQARVTSLKTLIGEGDPDPASPHRYPPLFDRLREGVEVIGFDWRYLYVNEAAASHRRQTKEVMLHSSVLKLYSEIENTALFSALQRCMEQRTAQQLESEFSLPDGGMAWFEFSLQPVPEGVLMTSLDISERKQTETALKRYAGRLEILHEIDRQIIEASSLLSLLEVIVQHLRQLIPCPRVSAALIDPKTGASTIFALDLNAPSAIGKGVRTSLPLSWFEGFDADRTRIIEDLRALPDPLPVYQQLINEGIVTSLQALLMDGERAAGVFALSAATPGFFTAEHQEIVAEIASQLAIAIKQLRLSDEVEQHARELEQRVTARTTELKAAKERVEAILNNSVDGIVLVDLDLQIQQANRAFDRLFAAETDEYFDRSLLTLIPAEDRERVIGRIEAVATERGQSFEILAQRLDGTVFDAEMSIGHIEGDGLVGTIRDITRRKEQERQLRYHARLQENMSDAVIVTDMAFRIQSWNRAAERIYGWRVEDILNEPVNQILKTEFASSDELARSLEQLRDQGWWQGEVIQHHQDGSQRHILAAVTLIKDESGVPFAVLSVNHDISDRKRAEDALHESQERFRLLVDNVRDYAIYMLDTRGNVTTWNQGAQRIKGYTAEEIIGQNFERFYSPEAIARGEPQRMLNLARDEGHAIQEDWRVRKDGTPFWAEVVLTPLRDQQNQLIGYAKVTRDLNEQRRAQEVLRQSEERFSLVFHHSPVAIGLTTAAEGRYLDVNDSLLNLIGYARDEIIGHTAVELNIWETPEQRANAARTIREAGSLQGLEVGFRRKSGEIRTTLTSIVPVMLNGQDCYLSLVYDITERKRAEAALNAKQAEEREFQHALKALHEITVELAQIDGLDDFYQHAIEQGIKRLGFERLGLLLYDVGQTTVTGTYGTNRYGKVVSEHHLRFHPADFSGMLIRTLETNERFAFDEPIPLFDNREPIGSGWLAAAVLWNGRQSLGWLSADNGIQHQPVSKRLLDILALYALAVGTLLAQKQAQADLRESEARYRLLAENITDVIARVTADGYYRYVSPSSKTVLGYEPQEVVGKSILDFIHTDDVPIVQKRRQASLEAETAVPLTYRFRHKAGHYLWLEVVRELIRSEDGSGALEYIASARNVTARQEAEEALKRHERLLKLILDTLPVGVWMVDLTGATKLSNPAGQHLWAGVDYIGPEQSGEYKAWRRETGRRVEAEDWAAARAIAKGETTLHEELEIEAFDGTHKYILNSGIPVRDEEGTILGAITVSQDITGRINAEEALRQALVQEKELNELKTRFVSVASHEFRTPLASILSAADTLATYRQRMDEATIDGRLQRIMAQVKYLTHILDDVLDLGRLQSGRVEFKPVMLDLDRLCQSVVDDFRSRPDVTHEIRYLCQQPPLLVRVDERLMRQVTINLVSNAIKYSPAEKPVVVELERGEASAILQVQDQGMGIPAADLKHLFEPFHRATNVGTIPGTGLGLSITKQAVELQGGTIRVVSTEDAGTTFIVTLPVVAGGETEDD